MHRIFRRRHQDSPKTDQSLSAGEEREPKAIDWGKVFRRAALAVGGFLVVRELGSPNPARLSGPPTASPAAAEARSFVRMDAPHRPSQLEQTIGWVIDHGPHLAVGAFAYDLLTSPVPSSSAPPQPAKPQHRAPPVPQLDFEEMLRHLRDVPSGPGTDLDMAAPARDSGRATLSLWTPPSDHQWLELAPHPSVTVIIGPRGSGKSHLAQRLLELLRVHADPYVVGPGSLRGLLPKEIGVVQRLQDVPNKAAVLIDEAYLAFGARNSMTATGRGIGELVNLSRQRGWSLIFVAQDSRQLDVNIISQADVIAIQGVSEIGREYERRELRPFTERARPAFATIQGDQRPWTWVYSEKTGFSGLVRHEPASYWREALSNAFAGAMSTDDQPNVVGKTAAPRQGKRLSKEELRARAKDLVLVRHLSYGQAAKMIGLSKSTVWDLVHDK